MSVQALHHVGIAVRSIDAQRAYYEEMLGGKFEGIEVVAEQQVRVAFFRFNGVRLELLEPIDGAGPIQAFLDQWGEGLHHVAFAVEDIQARIGEFKAAGFRLIDDVPRAGAHQMRIAFIHPKSTFGVLTELCEPVQKE